MDGSPLHQSGARKQSWFPIIAAVGTALFIGVGGLMITFFGPRSAPSPDPRPPVAEETITIALLVSDATGNPVAEQAVRFVQDFPDAPPRETRTRTDSGGFALVALRKAGTVEVLVEGYEETLNLGNLSSAAGIRLEASITVSTSHDNQ